MGEFETLLAIVTVVRVCPDTSNALYGQSMIAPLAIDMFGTEAPRVVHPPVRAGELALTIAISEPPRRQRRGRD